MPTAPLTAPFPEERRLITVLFADVVGFTAAAEALDYETVSDLIQEIWQRLDTVILRFGGYIDKHIGDAVMAVWGAPYAGDNDGENAICTALALIDSMNEFVQSTQIPGARNLKLRVGINTGMVYAGYVGTRREYTMIGDTVNVANRLEQTAEPGTVVIGDGTYRIVRGAFQVRRLAPMNVKGKTEPVSAFLVEQIQPTPGKVRYHSLDSLATCMVGRDAELARLGALYQNSVHADLPMMAIVTGEAGLGKSRLLMEFTSRLEVDDSMLVLLSARALDQAAHVPFYLWKTLWHARFGLNESDAPDVAREKFLRETQRLWGRQLSEISGLEAAHLIGSLTGLAFPGSKYLAVYENDPDGRSKRAFELTRELLRRICTTRPAAILLDDLQWADRGSLELLAYLFQPAEKPLPLLILVGARPEFLRQQPRWMNLAQVITLAPLTMNDGTVGAAYPDLHALPKRVLADLADRAEGNPYFLEEMVKSMVKAGVAGGNYGTDELLTRLRTQPPESLRAMIQARLDDLSREARAVALLASVIGRVFWVGAITAAARAASGTGTGPLMSMPSTAVDRVVQDGLRQLVRAELAFPRADSQFSDDQEYIFKHSLLREVAYSLIPHKYRQQYHLVVAHWLAARVDADFRVMAAEHFESAGASMEAARQYELAAQAALERGALAEAEVMWSYARQLNLKRQETV